MQRVFRIRHGFGIGPRIEQSPSLCPQLVVRAGLVPLQAGAQLQSPRRQIAEMPGSDQGERIAVDVV